MKLTVKEQLVNITLALALLAPVAWLTQHVEYLAIVIFSIVASFVIQTVVYMLYHESIKYAKKVAICLVASAVMILGLVISLLRLTFISDDSSYEILDSIKVTMDNILKDYPDMRNSKK